MTIREALFALFLAAAAVLVIRGVWLIHAPTAWIVAGLLTAVWSWLVLASIGEGSDR